MHEFQRRHERAVGEGFITWYNAKQGTNYVFDSRPREAPGLLYIEGSKTMQVEVTGGYYDDADAAFRWRGGRAKPDAPKAWQGVNFDEALIKNLNRKISDKCLLRYGQDCVLVVYLLPLIRGAEEIQSRLHQIEIPQGHPFMGIYLTGYFPPDVLHPGGPSGYRCWKLA